MIIEYYEPSMKLTFDDIDRLSAFEPDKLTWSTAVALELVKMGYSIKFIEGFDYKAFSEYGEQYIIDNQEPEVAKIQIEQSNIARAMEDTKELYRNNVPIIKKIPELSEITDLLSKGFFIICNINQRVLQGDDGFAPHFILLYDFDKQYIYARNPGPPSVKEQRIEIDLFLKAWSYGGDINKNILAVGRQDGST
jgi:hypothetical protein